MPVSSVQRRFLVLSLLAVLAVAGGLRALDSMPGPRQPILPASPRAPDPELRAIAGRLIRIDGDVLKVDDGQAERLVRTGQVTELARAAGPAALINHDLSRLRLGDSLFVSGYDQADGAVLARTITANVFAYRAGIVTAIGLDYLELRLQVARLSPDFAAGSTRVYLDPNAKIELLRPEGRRFPVEVSALRIGQTVTVQGFTADDGAMVALHVWPAD